MDDAPHASMKQCTGKCQQFLPATFEFFPKNNRGKLSAWCKTCQKAYSDQYYQSHKQQLGDKGKQHYKSHRDEILARQKRYVETHLDKVLARRERYKVTRKEIERERHRRRIQEETYREYTKQYRESHKIELLEYGKIYRRVYSKRLNERKKEYRQTEKGKLVGRTHANQRRAQKTGSGGSCTAKQIQEQLKRQKYRCYYCSVKLGKLYHIDHIVPLSRGGSHHISNLVVACPSCNLSKSDKLLHEWSGSGGRLL